MKPTNKKLMEASESLADNERTQHTPGPWQINAENSHHVPIIEGDKRSVAEVFGDGRDERNANARLIAAAPELLAVCQALLSDLESGYIAQDSVAAERKRAKHEAAVRAAIAKAEGRTQ